MRGLMLSLIWLLATGLSVSADEIAVGRGLSLDYTLMPGWELHLIAPPALVAETAKHVAHEAAAQGKYPTDEQVRAVAEKRLAANEAIIYHEISGSHLDIDFSPLEGGEAPPTAGTLKKSAEYALQSLEGEEGIHDVRADISRMEVGGAREAFRIDASYRHHAEPFRFIGIIGYADKHWFFWYFTAPGLDPVALKEVEALFATFAIKPGSTGGF